MNNKIIYVRLCLFGLLGVVDGDILRSFIYRDFYVTVWRIWYRIFADRLGRRINNSLPDRGTALNNIRGDGSRAVSDSVNSGKMPHIHTRRKSVCVCVFF